ncbi:hypothetical protein BT96DRAFT_404220 [Gymnopus androsaceus JB14]|uniref:Uncharacterized protein n=1 Tax=Gymnopus androsaceus JB14 TaxID=1447944 RepID=A0A6A4I6L2_9AGAR|nr:hypothetical protein BT96DRAFT_404220 [Gymnopus androsaceus JB14]
MSPSSHKAAQSVGLVVGAVLGTLIPIILFTVAAMLWWRNHKRKKALTHLAAEPFISLNFPENKILPNWLSAMQSMKFPSSKGQPMTSKSFNITYPFSKSNLQNLLDLVEQNSSGSTIEQLNAANALTMKLQQRLAVIQEQNQQRSTQPMVHTDSGLRLTEEAQQDAEVPPGYTAD